jgi:amino acid transporter
VGGAIWTAFAVALALAVFTAGAYAELVTKYPKAGGAATYVNRAYRKHFLTFIVAFAVMASGITSAATLSRAFAGDYFAQFIDLPLLPVALAFLVLVALINFRGISESVKLNLVLTIGSLLGLALIVLIGIVALADGSAEPSRNFEFKEGSSVFGAVLAGAALAFYALIGFEDSVNVAEETADPSRAFPRALFGGLLIAGTVYMLVTFTASMVVPTQQLADSEGPLLEVVREGPLDLPLKLFAAVALMAVANGALLNMVMASRLVYGMASQGIVPRAFAAVHPGRKTPWVAIIFTTALGLILIATGDLTTLAGVTVTLLLLVFIVVNISVLVLRKETSITRISGRRRSCRSSA